MAHINYTKSNTNPKNVKTEQFRQHPHVGRVSSVAVRSALVASSRSHRENGENGENTPVGDDGGNRPVRKHKPVGKKNPVREDGDDGEDIPVGYS